MKRNRLLLLLALLMTAATGAWAQEQSETIETASTTGTTVYTGEHFKITASLSCDGAGIVLAKPSNNGGKATIEALNGEMITKVEMHLRYGGNYATKTTATKGELVATDKTGENDISVINVNANSVVIGTTQSGSWIQVNKFVVYYSVPPTYTVSLKEGTKDAANWTISPSKATTDGVAEGTEVTLQYNGRLKVKGVKATSDAAPAVKPAATVTTAPTATTGDIVAGSETALVSGGTATGGTMMYKVTTANTKPTSTEGFSDAVPTAKTLEAGTYYVWYYVKADADHANSEISATAIAVTVKAVEGHALSAAAVGEIVGSDGKAYAAANKDNLPEGVEAVAMIWYVNGTHGLALALADEADDDNIMYDWETANTLCNAHTPAITGATWKLATQDDWNNMITGAGGAAALRDGFSSVVGENLQNSPYWSSTNYEWDGYAMHYKFNDFKWEDNGKEYDDFVRACLSW